MDIIHQRRSNRDDSVMPRRDALGGNRARGRIRLKSRPERDRAARLSERWDRPRSLREPYDFPTQQRGEFAIAMSATVFFFPREPRKSAREQIRKSIREHFASARERFKKSCP